MATSDPASLSAARENALERARQMAWKVCEVSPGQIRDDGWGVEELKAWLFAGCEAYTSVLGASPAPEPASGLNLAQMEAIYRWVISDPRQLPVAVSQAIERLYEVAGVPPAAPTAATPEPSEAALIAAHDAHDAVQRDPDDPEAIYTVTTAGLRAALKAAYAVDFGRRTLGGEPG